MNRNLDSVYFRVKRGQKYENICFSDLSLDERDKICADRSIEWFKSMLYIMTDKVKEIGDTFDIVSE